MVALGLVVAAFSAALLAVQVSGTALMPWYVPVSGLILAGILVLVGAIFIGKSIFGDQSADPVTVPNVVGEKFPDAQDAMSNLKLTLTKDGEERCDQPKGTVCSTNPAADEEVERGSTVTAVVSKGSGVQKVTVPDVTGMDADEAERSGLVARVVPAADLLAEAMKVADTIASMSKTTAIVAKQAVNRSFETTLEEGLLAEQNAFYALFATEDQSEGMSAFAEKRKPEWRR